MSSAPLPRRYWLFMLVLALLVRGGMLTAQSAQLRVDVDGYRELAHNLVLAGVYGQYDNHTGALVPEAFRAPLYPLLLAGCEALAPDSVLLIALLHAVLGSATVVIVLAVAWDLGLGRRSYLAALLVLFDPLLLHHSTLAMSETLATLLVSVVLLVVTRAGWSESRLGWALAGGSMALAVLCRPTFLVWVVLSIVWLVLGSEFRERRWLRVATFLTAAAILLAPWVLRNWAQLGEPIVATTHGGYTLHLGNNPDFYAHLRDDSWGTAWDGKVALADGERDEFARVQNRRMRPKDPSEASIGERSLTADRWHYEQAWQAIRAEPGMFARAYLMRWGYLTQLAPHQIDPHESSIRRAVRYAIGVWYAALYVLVVRGAWRIGQGWRRQPWAWSVLLVASFLLPHAFYWTNMRMRAPLAPVLALVAAAGAVCGSRQPCSEAVEPAC